MVGDFNNRRRRKVVASRFRGVKHSYVVEIVGIYGGKMQQQRNSNKFRAANGSAVNMLGETEVVALVSMVSEESGVKEEGLVLRL